MRKKVSVVMPTYGKAGYIEKAIESVFDQTYPNIELVIVDDNGAGSENQLNTEKRIEKWKDKIRYIVQDTNRGSGAARNTGVEKASGEYVAFLDDDDFYLDSYIESMVNELEKDSYDVVYEAEWFLLLDKTCFCAKKRPEKIEGDIHGRLLNGDVPITILFMFRKEIVQNIDLFHEGLMSYDEYDVWIRWTKKLRYACLTEPCAVVRRSSDNKSLTTNIDLRKEGLEYIKTTYFDPLKDNKTGRSVNIERILECGLEKDRVYQLRNEKHKIPWKMIKDFADRYEMSTKERLFFYINVLFNDSYAVLYLKMFFFRFRYETLNIR
ncbi:MAG: glycosyltransferase [Lachnospiraceae bacterium]|nr:glycosyltransferase [Lachnospiraceae bacterium]